MGLFIREQSDGRRSPGYLVYLLAALASVAGLWMLHRRGSAGADAPQPRRVRARASDVSPITQPAATLSAVEVAPRAAPAETPSYRIGRPPAAPARAEGDPADSREAGGFDAIDQALSGPADAGRTGSSGPAYPELPPALPPASAAGESGAASLSTPASGRHSRFAEPAGPPPQLFGYRDATADAATGNANAPARQAPAATNVTFMISPISPTPADPGSCNTVLYECGS